MKQIALDLYKGKIFSDRHISSWDQKLILPMVFMPLLLGAFSSPWGRLQMECDPPYFIFEDVSRAGPRSVNGYPMFTSLQWLNEADYRRMIEFYEQIKAAMEAVLGPAVANPPANPPPAAEGSPVGDECQELLRDSRSPRRVASYKAEKATE